MRARRWAWAFAAAGLLVATAAVGETQLAAKFLFSKATTPTDGPARPIGSYARGCLAGAVALPLDGPRWQVMRLSRNRNWGHPETISYVEKLSRDVARDGWNGLLVGDIGQPRGGPTVSGHASHQMGLDVDIWFVPMPDRTLTMNERETMSAVSLLMTGRLSVDPKKWSPLYPALLKRAVSFPEVARVFVSAAIKQKLCDSAGTDRAWLRKLRPWWGHDDHFHVRLRCPPGVAGCADQAGPGPGDGCGAELADWFKPKPPPKHPIKPKPELTLKDLPPACTNVLEDGGAVAAAAPAPAAAAKSVAGDVPVPRTRPNEGG